MRPRPRRRVDWRRWTAALGRWSVVVGRWSCGDGDRVAKRANHPNGGAVSYASALAVVGRTCSAFAEAPADPPWPWRRPAGPPSRGPRARHKRVAYASSDPSSSDDRDSGAAAGAAAARARNSTAWRAAAAAATPISSKPETPFKLATFEAGGKTRVGLVLDTRILDIAGANAEVAKKANLPVVAMPGDMRELIETYSRVSSRLYQHRQLLQGREDRRRAVRVRRAEGVDQGANQISS